ncbi:MAG: hypothetical protein AB2693_31000 [Candidatus Thiodiazotropha sp.]
MPPPTPDPNSSDASYSTIYKTAFAAVFVVASGLLGLIKLPAPVPSIALDAIPGYFTAGFISPSIGGIVGFFGHLASAWTGGFPLGWIHLVVALEMAVACFVFGWVIFKINKTYALFIAIAVAILINGILSPLLLGVLGLIPMSVAKGLVGLLTLASAINSSLAAGAIAVFSKRRTPNT